MVGTEKKVEVSIRGLKEPDRHHIGEMISQSGFFTPEEHTIALELVDTALQKPNQNDYYFGIAESGGNVLGYCCYGPAPMTEGTFDLYWICVYPDKKNAGIGKKLMAWAEDQIKQRKGRLIVVETSGRSQYESTRSFYLKIHYKEECRIKDFYKPGDDRVIYTKRI